MRRLLRRLSRLLLNLLTALSLVLFLAVAVVWVRGQFVSDRLFRYGVDVDGAGARMISETWFGGRGVVAYGRSTMGGKPEHLHANLRNMHRRAPGGRMPRHVTIPATHPFFEAGVFEKWFKYERRGGKMPGPSGQAWSMFRVVVPLWAVAAPLAVLPVVRAWRWRRRRAQRAAGLCLRCGYDLRATPGQCPECGAVSQPKAAA